MEHHHTQVNGTELHYVRAGSGPLMVLLHGFPQGWFIYRPQIEHFAEDHTVVAVDLRGFNLSAKPEHPRDYGTWIMAEDTKALVEHLGFETFTLVGHDTGGAVGYSMALHHPERLERLVVLSTAHPALFDRELERNPAQIAASQYLLGFRQPAAVDAIQANDFALLREQILDSHSFFTPDDAEEHLEAWRQPGAAKGMLGWYRYEGLGPREAGTPARGNFVPEVSPLTIETPSLVLYAENDEFVLPACFEGLDEYLPNLSLRELSGASHWLLNENPDLITEHIRAFISSTTELGAPAVNS